MSQIFQNTFPKKLFFEFIDNYCDKNNNQYIFSKESFKRIKIDEKVESFCSDLKVSSCFRFSDFSLSIFSGLYIRPVCDSYLSGYKFS